MRIERRVHWRSTLLWLIGLPVILVSGCQSSTPPEPPQATKPPEAVGVDPKAKSSVVARDEVPAESLQSVMTALYKGLGLMEQYRYREAVEQFREIRRLAPGWVPGSINLAIALLNDTGTKAAKADRGEPEEGGTNFDEATAILKDVLAANPDNRHAHYCLGMILEQQGDLAQAHEHFTRVTELDPNDALAWYWAASTLKSDGEPGAGSGASVANQQVALLTKALECDPYLTPAIYKLSFAYRLAGKIEKQKELLDRWREINPDRPAPVPGPGNSAEKVYGEMGKYASIINPFARSKDSSQDAGVDPRFEPARPVDVKLAAGDRWVASSDFQGAETPATLGRIRQRFGAAVASFDADRDGKADLYVAGAIAGPKGIRDALLLNKGEGKFEDASTAFGLPADRASVGVAAADFDADRYVDLFLTGIGENRLLRNKGGKAFEDISKTLKPVGPPALSLSARWLDLDQDGDLDLYIVNYCAAEHAKDAFQEGKVPPGIANIAFRNDGKPAPIVGSPAPAWAPLAVAGAGVKAKEGLSIVLTPWSEAGSLDGGIQPHTGVAAADFDGDRDLDLVLTADGAPAVAVLNDRLGKFHSVPLNDLKAPASSSGLLTIDVDADGRPDLVTSGVGGKLEAWRNVTERATDAKTTVRFESWPCNAERWRAAQVLDVDLDGRLDLVGLPVTDSKQAQTPGWARNESSRLTKRELPIKLDDPAIDGQLAVDLIGDPLPDLFVTRPGQPPALAKNLGNGHHWLALELGGHWGVKPQLMRTNPHAIGARLLIEGQGVHTAYDHTSPESGLGQSVGPVVLGLGKRDSAELLHIRWPDAVMQCELNVTANQKLPMAENNRKTGSCPVLFTWNGERFVCMGDFLGGGGLGYLVAPGVYGQPDRDESIAISGDQLKAADGVFRMSITEPMDEVAYLDHLRLEVVDRPPGVSTTPDERFAPSGTRPTGEILAWKETIEPLKAMDLEGKDATSTLKLWDRNTVDGFRRRDGWIGYAEEHGIILDFGDRLARFKANDRLVLCLAGWVEYPYSQTNYAAATAGISLDPPRIERLRADGTWELIEPDAGYPAGLPRMTTLELTGKLTGPNCVLRIKTNMECYYDQAFLMRPDSEAKRALKVSSIPVARAILGPRGYTREVSPDGRLPLLYEYDYVDPAPLARMAGMLTRFGEVSSLLKEDDDQLCLVGPGDEVRVEFDAQNVPPLPHGWTRSYVLKSYGYCKDADPFTAGSDTIEPLPWKAMPPYPFAGDPKRPQDSTYREYLRTYQTRPAGGGPSSR